MSYLVDISKIKGHVFAFTTFRKKKNDSGVHTPTKGNSELFLENINKTRSDFRGGKKLNDQLCFLVRFDLKMTSVLCNKIFKTDLCAFEVFSTFFYEVLNPSIYHRTYEQVFKEKMTDTKEKRSLQLMTKIFFHYSNLKLRISR